MVAAPHLPVAEVIAASLCWLARWQGGKTLASAMGEATAQVYYWHRDHCRFCAVSDMGELLALANLDRCHADEIQAWSRLSRKARAAKVYEAQEDPWWEKLP